MVRQLSGEVVTSSPSNSIDSFESSLEQEACIKLSNESSGDQHVDGCSSASSTSSGIGPSPPLVSSTTEGSSAPNKCPSCSNAFVDPKVLGCFHSACYNCLQDKVEVDLSGSCKVSCPVCTYMTLLGPNGLDSLLTDFGNLQDSEFNGCNNDFQLCSGCKHPESMAIARCLTCPNLLCLPCVHAHQQMLCFDSHHVVTMGELTHSGENRRFQELSSISNIVQEGHCKAEEMKKGLKKLEASLNILSNHFSANQSQIEEAFKMYSEAVEQRRMELLSELSHHYTSKQAAMSVYSHKCQEAIDKLQQMIVFIERLMKNATNEQVLLFKRSLEQKFSALIASMPEVNLGDVCNFSFVSSVDDLEATIKSTFGYIRSMKERYCSPIGSSGSKQPPICRPTSSNISNGNYSTSLVQGFASLTNKSSSIKDRASPENSSLLSLQDQQGLGGMFDRHQYMTGIQSPLSNLCINDPTTVTQAMSHTNFFEHGLLNKRFNTAFSPLIANLPTPNGSNHGLGQWSSDKLDSSSLCGFSASSTSGLGPNSLGNHHLFSTTESLVEQLSNKLITQPMFPPKSQIKRQKMIYHCKFGEFGVLEGQFTEPSGVAVNAQNDIIVADTNNHRIQIFDKEGRFKFQFGECGKRDGQLLYPNRVAVVRNSGDIIVTERSPTHQVQIYNQYGQFVRKFGANILQHPRGVCVDNKGRIIVVECKVMRVIIFDQMGNVLNKFGCSKHLEFPNGVVVNDRQEIFISDNRAHCVKVFNYDGVYLRQIGGEGITNYPIGVGITPAGEVTIADNHNNFNLTVFGQDGQLVAALESKVKHAQCFDVALLDDGSAVLASKDYRIYIYRYVQMPQLSY